MKVTVEVEITNCKDCIFRSSERQMNTSWEQCNHKKFEAPYGLYLWGAQEHFTKVPDKCPIGLAGAR